ncbi:MAG: NitT/TauT family transport system substrate-binding protein [Actinomycetota bacterium]|nr:NitT/TauT family transport system substrate-binding protein [Actinomycetota bacterium]
MTTRWTTRGKAAATAVVMVLAVSLLSACGSSSKPASVGTSGTTGSTTAPTKVTKIKFALDWTPNTNHTGLYVAEKLGYFKDAGLDVSILPYNNTSPDILVGAGKADFGISFQDSFTFSKAAGEPITSVMAVLQHTGTEIAVKADRTDINSPKDLDGKTYGGFGGPGEEPVMKQIIKNAGGTGNFKTVILSTAAYEALYQKKVDFTIPFIAWEAIQAKLLNEPLKTFKYTDYGFPDSYAVVVMANNPWLDKNPEAAAKFVQAMQKGYQYGEDHPKEAAQILIDENKGVFTDTNLVFQSQDLLAKDFLKDANGKVGPQTLEQWTKFSNVLYTAGVLKDSGGKALSAAPDYNTFFTNKYLSP